MRVFLSYRRDDSADAVGRVYDHVAAALGPSAVFKDVDSIPAGADFRQHLASALQSASVVFVVIGPDWLSATSASGGRRLDDPADFVRIEIEQALAGSAQVIPVCLHNAEMPAPDQLPPSLRELAFKQAVRVRRDPDFNRDVERLLATIQPERDASLEDGAEPAPRSRPNILKAIGVLAIFFLLGLVTLPVVDAFASPAVAIGAVLAVWAAGVFVAGRTSRA